MEVHSRENKFSILLFLADYNFTVGGNKGMREHAMGENIKGGENRRYAAEVE